MARCRLPGHDDEHPSFSVRSRTNRFNCFACNRGGDAIDLVRIMEGTDFLGACRWLGGRFGIDDTRSGTSPRRGVRRSEEHTSELQSLMRISYAVFCLKKKKNTHSK